jgi:ankyrin repeat protein
MFIRNNVLIACWICWVSAAALGSDTDLRLLKAVKNQDKQTARRLIEQHLDVNATEPDGATALAWASYWDDLETADLLIRSGAKPNIANLHGVTPLSLACTNRSALMVEKLLKGGADPNIPLWNGQTPLMTCARTGSLDAVQNLLEHGAEVDVREPQRGQTALMSAAAGKHAEIVQALIGHKANVNARTESGFTPLMFAAQQGDLDSTRLLLQNGADINAIAPKYGSALTVASASRHENLAIFLVDSGADSNVADGDGIAPLHYAVGRGIADITAVAPTAAFDPAYKIRPSNMPALAQALLAHGANPNPRITKTLMTFGTTVGLHGAGAPSMVDATPYLLAALSADVNLMRMLLAAGADPKLPARGNTTPLIAAAGGTWDAFRSEEEKAQALEAVKLVVELGANVNEPNVVGQTPMHAAAYTGATAVVQFLAEQGAKANVRSKTSETPWTMAKGISPISMNNAFYANHEETAAVLVKLGANPMTADEIEAFKRRELSGSIYASPADIDRSPER